VGLGGGSGRRSLVGHRGRSGGRPRVGRLARNGGKAVIVSAWQIFTFAAVLGASTAMLLRWMGHLANSLVHTAGGSGE